MKTQKLNIANKIKVELPTFCQKIASTLLLAYVCCDGVLCKSRLRQESPMASLLRFFARLLKPIMLRCSANASSSCLESGDDV